MSRPLVIYHNPCPDGFGAALAAWLYFGDTADYLGACPGKLPDVEYSGREVYFLDISFPRTQIEEVYRIARAVTIIDHHATAEKELSDLPGVIIDNTHSGAYLSWIHFHPDKPVPELLLYIEDRDLYRWSYPESMDILTYVDTLPYDFDTWKTLLELSQAQIETYREQGAIMRKKYISLVKQVASSAESVSLDGVAGHRLNCPGVFVSAIGNHLCKLSGTFAMLWRIEKGQIKVSLRSVGMDVGAIAERYGGGGHRKAAGFALELATPAGIDFFASYIAGAGG